MFGVREAYREIGELVCGMQQENADLKAENAKLRELCAGMWNVMWACADQRCQHRDNECFVVNGNSGGHECYGECWYKMRMRELGVIE